MSDIAVKKSGIPPFVSEHAGVWARFKWLLPILINVVVAMAGCARVKKSGAFRTTMTARPNQGR
jgi:hypothetical protein